MKTLLNLLILISLLAGEACFSQSKFGNTTTDELNMTVYPQDTTAAAVILLKTGETRFIYSDLVGFQFEYTLQVKIKILKDEGLSLCNQSISYFQETATTGEKITGLSGTTYNLENGKIVKTKLSKEAIFDENTDKKWRLKKFSMPGAKVGSVVEFKYTLTSMYFYDLRNFIFQTWVPVAYTSYEITIPEYFYYNVNMQGYEHIEAKRTPVNESFSVRYKDGSGRTQMENVRCNAQQMKFIGKNLSAIKNESYLWTIDDYVSKVSFELQSIRYPWTTIKNITTTWADIDKELFDTGDFGGNLKKAGLFKDEIEKSELTLDQAKKIQELVKSKVKWNEKRAFYPEDLKDALKDGVGNSADMNFLLINALKAGGFDAFPVVLSTRGNGRLPVANPSITALNYTITGIKIDTLYYYTDASARFGDWNLLPSKCMVPQARKIIQDNSSWVDLSTISSGNSLINAQIIFDDRGQVTTVTDIKRGNSSYDFKVAYHDYKDQNEYIEKLGGRLTGKVEDFTISGEDKAGSDVKVTYKLIKEAVLGDEFIYITPMIDKLFTSNPFIKEERKFPVNFDYPETYRQVVNIVIPEGYTVEELPASEKFVFGDNEAIQFAYRIGEKENIITFQYQFKIKELMILQDSYPGLRDFFAKVISKNSEQIVLKKNAQ